MFAGIRLQRLECAAVNSGVFTLSILAVHRRLVHLGNRARCLRRGMCTVAVLVEGRFVQETHEPALYGFTHPIGAAVFIYMILRAMIGTLWRGGIIWRGTFYPLDELRKGMV